MGGRAESIGERVLQGNLETSRQVKSGHSYRSLLTISSETFWQLARLRDLSRRPHEEIIFATPGSETFTQRARWMSSSLGQPRIKSEIPVLVILVSESPISWRSERLDAMTFTAQSVTRIHQDRSKTWRRGHPFATSATPSSEILFPLATFKTRRNGQFCPMKDSNESRKPLIQFISSTSKRGQRTARIRTLRRVTCRQWARRSSFNPGHLENSTTLLSVAPEHQERSTDSRVAAQSVRGIMRTEISLTPCTRASDNLRNRCNEPPALQSELRFRDETYSYPAKDKDVHNLELHDVRYQRLDTWRTCRRSGNCGKNLNISIRRSSERSSKNFGFRSGRRTSRRVVYEVRTRRTQGSSLSDQLLTMRRN